MENVPDRLAAALADRYRIEHEIGEGGTAVVYLAEDLKHQRRVAIKVLRPQVAVALGPERFEDEIRIAARLHHPHILQVFDSGEADGFLYYVMPYVEGQSLRERIQQADPIPYPVVARLLYEVADALAEAHKAGIVHRDIKPENILLAGKHVVVTDFGIAKAISDASERKSSTSLGMALGTPAYMSPEQASSDPSLDHRADIYALGIVGYEMLAGHTPFSGSAQQVLTSHLTTKPEAITIARPGVPVGLANVVMKALAKDPAERWQSAEAMQQQLEPLLNTTSNSGWTPTVAVPAAARAAKPRMLGIGIAVAAALLVVGLLAWNRLHTPAAPPADALAGTSAAAAGTTSAATATADAGVNPKSIAVLPFENLSSDKDNAYFAEGIQDEILTRLAKVGDLKVISRTSTQRYASQPDNLKEIAKALGVANIVEGSVQKVGDAVRINVQLIRANTDAHLWAESYDRKLVDVFAIQSEVATAIAAALNAHMTDAEQRQVERKPTQNADAYSAYLKGLSVASKAIYDWDLIARARDFFLEAIRLDPDFVEAYAQLQDYDSLLYSNGIESTPAVSSRMKKTSETAMRLRPDSSEAWIAVGFYKYRGLRDFQGGLDAFSKALVQLPNDARILGSMGAIERRLGRMDQAMAHVERAAELDPASPLWPQLQSDMLVAQRRFPEARAALDHGLTLAPGDRILAAEKIKVWLDEGNLQAAGKALAALPPMDKDPSERDGAQSTYDVYRRDFDSALARAKVSLAKADAGPEGAKDRLGTYTFMGFLLKTKGDRAGADAQFRLAKSELLRVMAASAEPNRLATQAARIETALGDPRAGLAALDRALLFYKDDLPLTAGFLRSKAEVLAQTGDATGAITLVQRSLAMPYGIKLADLRLDPDWDPLRKDPRFQALVTAPGSH